MYGQEMEEMSLVFKVLFYHIKLGCRNWTVVALNREGWRKLLKEAEAHPRL
jgi:hypothetical protein